MFPLFYSLLCSLYHRILKSTWNFYAISVFLLRADRVRRIDADMRTRYTERIVCVPVRDAQEVDK